MLQCAVCYPRVDHFRYGWRGRLVAPFEFDGHSDHEAVARACRRAADESSSTLVRYPIWALHRGCQKLLEERRGVRFDLGESAMAAKRAAMSEYRSQIDERPGGAILPPHVLDYFRQRYEIYLL